MCANLWKSICGRSTEERRRCGMQSTSDVLEQIAQRSDPHARVWRGFCAPLNKQGTKFWGPLGHPQFVEAWSVQEKGGVAGTHSRSLTFNPHGPCCFMRFRVKPEATRGLLTATQRGFVEVRLQDLARRPRTLRRGESGSVPCH